eukprot:CAMPEP_0177763898 /NCGR_PEP_ID=MMETSP0491_2-20121128/7110_1 /TAXON_ID=63592 /ORGANISM="Tetraselmis chuii, Strain PLY429" /LENGTH=231 /DNA_ID=CAMNT_0019280023 /DNA_START=189 /DNA_END=884 /DNA_ORIENTATION=-
MASTTASPASNAHQFARTVFFLAVALQLPLVPLLPYAADGESVDKQAEPEYSSPLQVVMGVMLTQVESKEPVALLMMAAPGALVREAANMGACELGLEACVPGTLYDWSSLPEHPEFRPSSLRPRIIATYPDNVQTLFAGCLLTTVASLLCLYTANKLAVLGVGITMYVVMSQGIKLSPWTGIMLSSALSVAGFFEVARNAAPPTPDEAQADGASKKKKAAHTKKEAKKGK